MASNKDLSEMVADDTGNRRFFQIEVKKSFEALKDRDFIAAWRSIDENSLPISKDKFDEYVEPFQELNKRKSKQEEFIKEFNLVSVIYSKRDVNKNYFQVPTSILAKIYSEWGGFKINVYGNAYKELISLLKTESHSITINGYKQKIILIEDSCTLDFVSILTRFKKKEGFDK
jgi:hypothetical protein